MLVVGINLGHTRYSKPLKDGATCLVDKGRILVALAEERVTREKYQGGFRNSLKVSLDYYGITQGEIDLVVVSSCCETPRTLETIDELKWLSPEKFIFLNHHLSHAYSSFVVSPFEKAITVIADGGGNILQGEGKEWWSLPREQISYFLGEDTEIRLLGRDFEKPYEAGLGEIYRYFTHYLGWHSFEAGKVMSLAALGDPSRFGNIKLIRFDPTTGQLTSIIRNEPLNDNLFTRFLEEAGFGKIPPRKSGEDLRQIHYDLARYVQDQLSHALLEKVNYLSEQTGIRKLCLAGGVALNCITNDLLLRKTPIEEVFIQPAAGDHGQSIGNAIHGSIVSKEWIRRHEFYNPYLGLEHDWSREMQDSFHLLPKAKIDIDRIDEPSVLTTQVAKQIADGKIVGWVQGRSESGPRALGNRSILADSRTAATVSKLNAFKKREWFMPVAPAVTESDAYRYFLTASSSPYMLRAIPTTQSASVNIPAVIHSDGTARIQTVNREQNQLFYDLLLAFKNITGIPVLANTSFNRQGEPIVETATDAILAFVEMKLDMLVVGNWVCTRYG